MYTIVYKPNPLKTAFLAALTVLCYIAVYEFMSNYLLHSTMTMVSLTVLALIFVLRAIGIVVMYPGSFHYISAEVEKKENDALVAGIHSTMLELQEICRKVVVLDADSIRTNLYTVYAPKIVGALQNQNNLISKPRKRSKKKQLLIHNYQRLLQELSKDIALLPQANIISCQTKKKDKEDMHSVTCRQILSNPKILLNITNQLQSIKTIFGGLIHICQQIWLLCQQINSIQISPLEPIRGNEFSSSSLHRSQHSEVMTASKFKIAKWHFFSERLFLIDSYYAHWDDLFNYSRMIVSVGNGYQIECAIIHAEKQGKDKVANSSKAVLFCNPNGALLQSFALNSSYINFYLRWGFRIVLWNYRGYGNSTGFATISNCKSDVYKVYLAAIESGLDIVVVHGYSIGGVCAIDLTHKLNRGHLSNPPIQLLVADRTFSSVDRVAQGFFQGSTKIASKLLKCISVPIVRLLFATECEDQSRKFSQIMCEKVLIYDLYDQIIQNQSSLKYALLKLSLVLSKGNQKLPGELRTNVKSFALAVVSLFENNSLVFQNIMRAVSKIGRAGIGIKFEALLKQFDQKNKKPLSLSLYNQAVQYFTAVIIFGPKININNFTINHMREGDQHQEKRRLSQNQFRQCIIKVKQIFTNMFLAEKTKCEVTIQNIIKALQFAYDQQSQSQYELYRNMFGHLIISEVGHNSELQSEYHFLDFIIRSIASRS